MIPRRQLPVHSPISPLAVASAATRGLFADAADGLRRGAREAIGAAFSRDHVLLTDSGTSALVIALRIAAPAGGTVAMPAYACIDLAAAARRAGVKVTLYDLNPRTLGPDEESLRAALEEGAAAVVIAHLFGYPVDVVAVQSLASGHGAVVIEDAAQGAFGTLGGRVLGSLGALSVLSFGRGKGMNAAGGGALLADAEFDAMLTEAEAELRPNGHGIAALAATAAQWVLGRPQLYALPSALPFLHLGEMVYHPADEPAEMTRASAALVPEAIEMARADVRERESRALRLKDAARQAGVETPESATQAIPGYLRLPVLPAAGVAPNATLGMVRPYPVPLQEHGAMQDLLTDGARSGRFPGASALALRLISLPVHRYLSSADERLIGAWLNS